ncbi:transcriptional repressor [Paenibacillus alvei]|uniref:Transcriptional repressor n=1 Tax=Paenibacillus alvei TaxID=44250 RepID=A0ABT4H1U8_PAEAL|nr:MULTISPECIES: transcriptional repressor [Paenibacillus]EJW19243.1 Fe2+/Zn2+ uptake regulation protein [Paenibacillus alvei DSM 29]MBG9734827.1 Fe2+/Zn2+ uptake regulation protein [Paenibacillus alvei]MBG9744702.1 Fe2+/Zn2+ uptake regulation protein [Paenibacillus alvei]MCY7483626.1 transcriptional repressor [Paenibacillus alvei]MCY9542617.1 transcriptional repressor [Paenibacillus alvei]
MNRHSMNSFVQPDNKRESVHLTQQREAVLSFVNQAESPATAIEIYIGMRANTRRISLSTVYCSLKYFVKNGIVRELNEDHTSKRYECIAK